MKYFRYVCGINKKFIALILLFSLCIDLLVFTADLQYVGTKGFWVPIVICLAITLVAALICFSLMWMIYKRNKPVFEVMDKPVLTDELIDVYKRCYPNMTVKHHITLSSYLRALGHIDEAETEIMTAGQCVMADVTTRAFYSEGLISQRILQGRFNDAILLYNNYNPMMEAYCRSNKNSLAVSHYAHGALLYAYSGNYDSAMICIRNTEPAVKKDRALAFTRNTALMCVYLMMGDYRNADSIKNMMLRDLETFKDFTFESHRSLAYRDIDIFTAMFDPRAQAEKR